MGSPPAVLVRSLRAKLLQPVRVSEPDGRGTFSLMMTSCLLTLSLCVWSAMHLNIPHYQESRWQFWLRHVKWGLVGIFAPELVVFAAWRQHISASAVRYEILQTVDARNLQKEPQLTETMIIASSNHNDCVKPPWTMVHGHYAGMGGLIFKLDGTPEYETNNFIPGFPRLTLTARGVALLAKCNLLPVIQEEDLADKSKADGLAKFLACLQAGWMFVQIITRVFLGLPITLLEVNTLGHIVCALVIYVLWWSKPRSINEPTRLVGDWVRPICAYMFMSSQISGKIRSSKFSPRSTEFGPELSKLAFYSPKPPEEQLQTETCPETDTADSLTVMPRPEDFTAAIQRSDGPIVDVSDTQSRIFDATICGPKGICSNGSFEPRPSFPCSTKPEISGPQLEEQLPPTDERLQRWRLAADAVRLYPAIRTRFILRDTVETDKSTKNWLEPCIEELVTEQSGNWPNPGLLRGVPGLIMGMILWSVSIFYGGVHAAAWNDSFPSEVEAWLWRSSSIYAAFCGLIWLLINLIAHISKPLNKYWDEVLAFRVRWIDYLVLGALCFVCGVTYILARVFLVIEAFISLRQLPLAAYQTPDWTQLIPHL